MIDQILEPLRPLKNLREMGKAMFEMRPGDVVKNYFQAAPGVFALSKLTPIAFKYAGYAAVKLGLPMKLAAMASAKSASSAVGLMNWFLQPAQKAVSATPSVVKAIGKGVISPAGLAITGAVAGQHLSSRILKNRVSLIDLVYALGKNSKPTAFQKSMMDKKTTIVDWMFGDPVSVAILKGIYKIKGGKKHET